MSRFYDFFFLFYQQVNKRDAEGWFVYRLSNKNYPMLHISMSKLLYFLLHGTESR